MTKSNRGSIVELSVRPNSPTFRIDVSEDEITVFCRSPPERGRANLEIVKWLSKTLRTEVVIVGGAKSRRKRVLIAGLTPERIRTILAETQG